MTGEPDDGRRAPPERLAAFRIVLGTFVTTYLLLRHEAFVRLGERGRSRFEPVGVLQLFNEPLSGTINNALIVLAILSGIAFTVGWHFRVVAPIFAVALLLITTHRSSWGQLLHFENLMTLHVMVIAPFAAADAWSLDSQRRHRGGHLRPAANVRYRFPLVLAGIVLVVTYFIAGFAKLRYGGLQWVTDDTLLNHIAYTAVRLDLLGATPSPLATIVVEHPHLLRILAGASVAIELLAPVALLGDRCRNIWVASAWSMHVGILALMLIGFPSPLFLVAFAPLFRLERLIVRSRWLSAAAIRRFSGTGHGVQTE